MHENPNTMISFIQVMNWCLRIFFIIIPIIGSYIPLYNF